MTKKRWKEEQNLELAEVGATGTGWKETENAEKSGHAAGTTDMLGNLPASSKETRLKS